MTQTILMIDDEEDILIVTQRCLELEGGWEVMVATSSAEGLELAEQCQPDAILLDVMMPDMDGATTIKRLKANPATASIPVVFLTAKRSPTERDWYLGLGAVAVVGKPFDPLEISRQISDALGWQG
ncbi:MAG: response regulator [Limnospira sp.]